MLDERTLGHYIMFNYTMLGSQVLSIRKLSQRTYGKDIRS